MIRTAAAFGFRRVLLGGCADLYHPKTVRASMGALYRMQVDVCDRMEEALAVLQSQGHRILAAALEEDCLTLGKSPLYPDDCIVIGNEGHGVSPQVLACADAVVKIPMEPDAESLNAAGAAAVLMWEYYRAFME
jgi:TrmH family RNA methyltransferase